MLENKKQDEQADYGKLLTLPFIKGFSERIERKLRKEGVTVVLGKGKLLKKRYANSAQKSPRLSKDNNY